MGNLDNKTKETEHNHTEGIGGHKDNMKLYFEFTDKYKIIRKKQNCKEEVYTRPVSLYTVFKEVDGNLKVYPENPEREGYLVTREGRMYFVRNVHQHWELPVKTFHKTFKDVSIKPIEVNVVKDEGDNESLIYIPNLSS